MALALLVLVDVVGRLNDDAYDRFLLALALMAPLAMLALGQWRSSLDTWYAVPGAGNEETFGPAFQEKAALWGEKNLGDKKELVVILDRSCPCTKAAISALETAKGESSLKGVHLSFHYIEERSGDVDPLWRQLLKDIPATPTVLSFDNKALIYAGPIASGNFCTTNGSRVLGLTALESTRSAPLLNWLNVGCYCRLAPAEDRAG